MDPKRILLVNEWGGSAGGTESYVHSIAAGLTQRGYDVGLLYAKRGRPPLPASAKSALCPGLTLSGSVDIDRDQVRRIAAEFRPDVVHVNRLAQWEPTLWLATEFPTVAFLHDQFPLACPGFGKFLKSSGQACDRRVGPFCAIAPLLQGCGSRRPWVHLPRYAASVRYRGSESHLKKYFVASEYMRKELVSNGVDAGRVALVGLPGPEPWGTAGGGEGILYVGRLTPDKGVALLVEAVARMRPRPRLVVIGEGPLRGQLTDRASELGLEADFYGWSEGEALHHAYDSTAIVVVPSLWPEPFGLVGLEAMAAARPIIGFDRGGIGEWLKDGENGRLLKETSADALAEAMGALLRDEVSRVRMGNRGKEMLSARFSAKTHLDRLTTEYRAAFGSGRVTESRIPSSRTSL